jgi:hypothetical protein
VATSNRLHHPLQDLPSPSWRLWTWLSSAAAIGTCAYLMWRRTRDRAELMVSTEWLAQHRVDHTGDAD